MNHICNYGCVGFRFGNICLYLIEQSLTLLTLMLLGANVANAK